MGAVDFLRKVVRAAPFAMERGKKTRDRGVTFDARCLLASLLQEPSLAR